MEALKKENAALRKANEALSREKAEMAKQLEAALNRDRDRDPAVMAVATAKAAPPPPPPSVNAAPKKDDAVQARHVAKRCDELIDELLCGAGHRAVADRAYFFQFREGAGAEGQRMCNTHEWVNKGIAAYKEKLADIPSSDLPWIWAKIAKGEEVIVNAASDADDAPHMAFEMLEEGIHTLALVPCHAGSAPGASPVVGFVGFDACRPKRAWRGGDLATLRRVGAAVAALAALKAAAEAVEERGAALEVPPYVLANLRLADAAPGPAGGLPTLPALLKALRGGLGHVLPEPV